MQAQTTKNAIDLLQTTTAKKPKQSKKDDGSGDFLSMVLNAAANKAKSGESITETDVKEIAKSVNMQTQAKEQAANQAVAKVASELANKLDETTKNELYENANFMQLLQVLEILNGGEVSKFPNFSDKIASFLSNPQNVVELAGVKSLNDLIDLAKKFDLGLKDLNITTEDVENLSKMFENLGKKDFFTPIAPKPLYTNELKNQVEQNISNNQTSQPAQLNQLLNELSKQTKAQPATTTQSPTQTTQAGDQAVATQIAAQADTDEAQTQNLTQNLKEPKEQKTVNLQSLLFPERQQSSEQNFSENPSGQSEQNPLEAMVRDISRAASNQMQEKTLVRETLSNFSENLKEQIQNYKAPFTRVNLTLNPLNLGEVEITMVTRGNNLHINFNSTTTTMALFLQNQAEFKNSLVNMGFTELEMNFSDQQQKQEQGRDAYKQNAQNLYVNEQESDEVEQNLLEIVIPRYI